MNVPVSATLSIHTLEDADTARWDAFVEACPQATFFHRAGWRRVLSQSLGHTCHFLFVARGGDIRGVLPLVHIRSRLFGNSLISNAFCVYGGPAAVDAEARDALDSAAVALAERLGVDVLTYKLMAPRHDDWVRDSELYATFRREISADHDENMKAIPRKQRAMVRKGIKNDLRSEVDSTIDRFYPIYAASVHGLGTPVFSATYIEALRAEFGEDCEILSILHGDEVVASVMSFYFRSEVLPYYAGGTEAARGTAAYDFMYWEVMRRAVERGCTLFDFGRSKRGTGAFSFKEHWGFEPQALHYETRLVRASEPPNVNPLNPKYRMFIAMWKRLPLPIANLLGPMIARDLG
jgi:FemAB-related protein (PEP-CTERM system-associated)